MKYEALVSHCPAYRSVLKEYEQAQPLLVRRTRKTKAKQDEIIRRTYELDELRRQLSAHQWTAPIWTHIEGAIAPEHPTEVRLRELDKMREDLVQHIGEVRTAPLVSAKTHVDIDKIDRYLDGLQSLLGRIDIERRELAEEHEPVDTRPTVTYVKELAPFPAVEVEPDLDAIDGKKLLTFGEAAAFLGITEHTLENKISEGTIPESCIDPDSPTGRKRRFYREKLGQIQRAKKKQAAGEYEKIMWLSTPGVFEKLVGLLADHEYLEPVALPKRHYTDKIGPVPTKHPLDWRYEGKIVVALAHLASLVYIIHRKGAIAISGGTRSLHIPSYMVSHFTLNGKPIAKRTAEHATADIRQDDGQYVPHSEIATITSMVFSTP
jgi:hypothetical protein